MSSKPSHSARRTVLIIRCLFAACVALAVLAASEAHAAEYKMLGCSATAHDPFYTISGNTASPQNPAGIFNFWNSCNGQGGDPPGDAAYLRIEDNQANGTAGNGAFLAFNFDTPNQFIHFRAAGGYTREPAAFNEGWRSRLLISGGAAGSQELMSQGSGLCNCGDQWAPTGVFASHLWPLGGYRDFTRFTFEMVCLHVGGCDRTGVNAADLNGMVFVLSDEYPSAVNLIGTDQPFLAGYWVRGPQTLAYNWTELGSGMKTERTRVDGATYTEIVHNCDEGFSQTNGVYARTYQPCDTAADIKRFYTLETANLADGAHTIAACTQDFAQWQNLGGSGGESCDSRIVHTDNTAPGAPAGLEILSGNPARYLQHFSARWQLPPNQGSPIAAVHYDVVNAAGAVVVPERTVAATDPSALSDIEGPKAPGDYRLRLWLEDSVGFVGPKATVAIPHDSTPPAAPQSLSASGPASWSPPQGYRLNWQDIRDSGSPIVAASYEVLDGSGAVVVPPKTSRGENIEAVPD
ncbi:MAG TPA: hypothetical protein VFV02_10220, partial [Acidimicrobiales bacterium]|nr:hypothetical protein [Acidimicrobiales bacterium]